VPPGYVQHLSTLQRAPIGTGPYILKSISSAGDMAVLERNPHYWGTTPAVSQVTVKQIDDDQTRLAALQSGGADIITDVPPDLASSLPAVAVNQSIENSGILFNALAGVTANQNVRIALNLALDKNTMVAKLYNKYAQVSNCQYTSPGSTGYDPHLKPYPYDPAKARALLQSAGAIGKTIDLETASDYAGGRQLVESVASYWEAVGLKVNIVISPHASFIGDIFKGRQRPAAMFVLAGDDLRDASQTNRFFATGLSLSAYSNPQLDSLYKQASNAQRPSNRTALLKQVEKFACDQALIGFLWNSLYIDGHRSGLNMIPRQEGWIYFPEISFK